MTKTGHASFTLAQLAAHVGGEVSGDSDVILTKVGTLADADNTAISFLTNPKYKSQMLETAAGAVIIHPKMQAECKAPALIHQNPHAAFARIAQLFDTTPPVYEGIHATAVVADDAEIGEGVSLGPYAVVESGAVINAGTAVGAHSVIGKNTTVGSQCIIHRNVTLYHDVELGDRVTVHSQTVIGSDGFGYANDAGTWLPIPQTGRVVIGDDSQVGASTSIDRGALEDTVIGKNVIIDNQVQIAHNCVIGDHSCICGSTGIAGSCHIGKYVVIAGHCGINGHITICDQVQITGYSMVINDIVEPGVYSGTPVVKNRDWLKNTARIRQLDDLNQRVKKLENQ